MRILIDMNLSPLWEAVLRDAGYEAVHWSQCGANAAPDAAILTYARVRAMVVFTHDLDFGTLLAYTGDVGPSVVQLREQNIDPAVVGPAVIAGLRQCEEDLEVGALVTIDLRRAKARLLPLRRATSSSSE